MANPPVASERKVPLTVEHEISQASAHKYLRFPLVYRLEHWVVVISFVTLAVTGLVQKYAAADLSKTIIRTLGGIEGTRTIHHIFATVLLVEVVYHLGAAIYRLYVLRYRPSIVPNVYDVRSAIQALLYNLGLSKTAPQQGRYTFEEKMEYWAMVWGTLVMAITGFMMWNPLATTRFLPGEFIPAAKAAHGGEALLAVLAIIIWHMYGVHIKTFNKSMFNGKLDEKEMLHEHPLELADIKAGLTVRPVTPQGIARRKQLFYPVYGILGVLLLFGVYKFVTLEQTALATAPNPENVAIYAPLTPTPLPTQPPTPTPLPPTPTTIGAPSGGQSSALLTTWEGGIGALFSKCSGCHGASNQASGLNLSSYTSTLAGGKNGPGIVPGKPDQSQIYIVQSQGGHFVQLTSEELGMLKTWIEAGAPEK